jgi:hypothetical protein
VQYVVISVPWALMFIPFCWKWIGAVMAEVGAKPYAVETPV